MNKILTQIEQLKDSDAVVIERTTGGHRFYFEKVVSESWTDQTVFYIPFEPTDEELYDESFAGESRRFAREVLQGADYLPDELYKSVKINLKEIEGA